MCTLDFPSPPSNLLPFPPLCRSRRPAVFPRTWYEARWAEGHKPLMPIDLAFRHLLPSSARLPLSLTRDNEGGTEGQLLIVVEEVVRVSVEDLGGGSRASLEGDMEQEHELEGGGC